MEIKTVLVIHALMLIVGGIRKCLATKYLTVAEGETMVLKCPLQNFSEKEHMEWKNPQGHLLFFNREKVLRDPRGRIFTFNNSEYTLHLSNVTLKDEGLYRCLMYGNKVISKRFKVKVLGVPKIEMVEDKDKTIIKCSTEANGHPPELSWQISGVEIEAITATKKYSSTTDEQKTHTTITATSTPAISSTAQMSSMSENAEALPTDGTTSNSIQVEENSTAVDISLMTHNINSSESNSPDEFLTTNDTNSEGSKEQRETNPNKSSPLLILLVTCLVICLLIVVIFFVIRLRRAHVAWKKENEESDQSMESSKSKSSHHEEKQAQGRRKHGFWNSNFTEYKVEEIQNTANTVATTDVITETQDISTEDSNKLDKACVKETEL